MAEKTKETPKTPSLVEQTKTIITAAGKSGIGALAIATKLNLIKKDMTKIDRTATLKKVRTLARKAQGGKPATKRDGRSAIYCN